MNILLAASEAVPFAKTGGLADVATGLSRALAKEGHQVTLAIPCYRRLLPDGYRLGETVHTADVPLEIQVGPHTIRGEVLRTSLPGSSVNVLLIDQPMYFDRDSLYVSGGQGYHDNCERFVFFSRAVVEAAARLDLQPDVIHCNDWQTGLIPALLDLERHDHPALSQTACVMTIHNLAFQGSFPSGSMPLTGLDWRLFNWEQMEAYGDLNLLKTGLIFSQMITTVSPTYACEIQTAANGCGLEDVLAYRQDRLRGILNGVDTSQWDPATDPHLPATYNIETVWEGKPTCKRALQEEVGLPTHADVPLFGMISRMSDQKGFDLIDERAEELLRESAQFVFLGTGDDRYERMVQSLAKRAPEKVAAMIGFKEGLAHRIEAGADAYLMPSRFEPCGLNQMYSLTYGTPPIVTNVGGLADSVVDATEESIAQHRATGFVFHRYDSGLLREAIERAMHAYRDRPLWESLVTAGMAQDWSWRSSAEAYVDVYQEARARKRG